MVLSLSVRRNHDKRPSSAGGITDGTDQDTKPSPGRQGGEASPKLLSSAVVYISHVQTVSDVLTERSRLCPLPQRRSYLSKCYSFEMGRPIWVLIAWLRCIQLLKSEKLAPRHVPEMPFCVVSQFAPTRQTLINMIQQIIREPNDHLCQTMSP